MSAVSVGQVDAVEQGVSVERPDGSVTPLAVGDPVFLNDTIITGALGAIQIVFSDGTTFALGPNGRITIDEFVYDPAGADNGLAATLLQGSFVFLTGAIAPAPGDGITVDTPVGTMGIRGTFGGGGQPTPWSEWTIALFPEGDGKVGRIVVSNAAGEAVLEVPFEALELPGYENLAEPKILSIDEALGIFAAALDVGVDDLLALPVPKEPIDGGIDYEELNSGSGGFGRFDDLFRGGVLGDALDPTVLRLLAILRLLEQGTLPPSGVGRPLPPPFDDSNQEPIPDAEQQPVTFGLSGPSLVAEGDTAIYTVSYTGATLAPGQTATISVATAVAAGGAPDAVAGQDYTALLTVLTFTSGTGTSQTVAVSTIDDTVVEGTEDFTVTLSGPSGGLISVGEADTALLDDNDGSLLRWSVTGATTTTEGDTAIYTVSYTGATLAPGQTATISVATAVAAGGAPDAVAGQDYTALLTVLTFTSGTGTSQTVAVSAIDDTVVDATEDFTVTLSGPSNGLISVGEADTALPDDNDGSLLRWSVAGATTITEGGTADYTVSYTGATLAPGQTMTIAVASNGGFDTNLTDALPGTDYTALNTTLTFTGGAGTAQVVSVETVDDTELEPTEDYTLTIANPTAGSVSVGQANTAIADDSDATLPVWNVAGDSIITEGNAATYTVSYTGLSLSEGQTLTVQVRTGAAGFTETLADASASTDLASLATVLTFTAGTGTSRTVSVSVVDDTVVEDSEDYEVHLGGPSIGSLGISQANTVIEDDGDGSLLSWTIVGDSSVTEGGTAQYTVSYTGATLAPGQTMTVAVASNGGFDTGLADAQSGTDFTALTTTLTFTGGGAASRTVAVATVDDTVVEGSEDYTVTIASPTAGTVATGQANTIIADDDGTSLVWHIGGGGPALTGGPITASSAGGGDEDGNGNGGGGDETVGAGDGDGGSTELTWSITGTDTLQENAGPALFTISYTGALLAAGQTALVTVETAAGANPLLPNATSGVDFGAVSTVLTFTAGTGTTRTVSVSVVNDATAEAGEDFAVTIGGASIGQLGATRANIVIEADGADGRPAPIWSVAGSSAVEEGADATYTVAYAGMPLSEGQTATITLNSAVGGFTGTLTNAIAGADYGSLSTVLTFTRGTGTARTVSVSTVDDGTGEGSEDFRVTLSGQSVGTLNTTQANTIITEETATVLEWNVSGQAAVSEGATAIYTISYEGPSLGAGQTANVTVATGTGSILTMPNATSGSDFTALSTVLTFTSGSGPTRTIGVSTVNDTAAESGEDYAVRITGASQGTIGVSHVDTVISIDPADGDVPLFWNLTGNTIVGEGGTAIYTVSYTGNRIQEGETETVQVTTAGGFTGTLTDATPGIDYGSASTTLTFTAGSPLEQTFQVSTVNDTAVEGDEDYTVRLTGVSSGSGHLSQVNTIIDELQVGPSLEWHVTGDPIAGEMNSVAHYTVGYTGDTLAPGETATVTVGTGGGFTSTLADAQAGVDHTSLSTVLTFTGGGAPQQTVGVSIVYDDLNEGLEDYTVTIGGASAGTVVTSQADTVIDIVNNTTTVNENGGPAVYTVWYTGAPIAPGVTATITVATDGGFTGTLNDATGNVDYTSVATVLTFTGGGPTYQTIAVSLIDDTLLEGDEDYTVTIGGQSDGSVGTSQSNTVIVDDDASNLMWHVDGASQVVEGNSATYTVSYTGGAIAPGATAFVTVATSVADIDPNDATPGVDYTTLTTILTFTGGGATAQTVAVSTIEDGLAEPTEDYQVEISASAGAIGTGAQHTNIVDDDGTSLVWSIAPGNLGIDESEHKVVTVSYAGATIAPGFTAFVTVATGGGWTGTLNDATSDVDYTSFTSVLTFTSGTGTSQTLGISTLDDTIVEGTEDFTITIGGVSNGSIGASQVNAVIVDNDATALVWNVFGAPSVAEGGSASYTVSYAGAILAPGVTATVAVASSNAPGGTTDATAGLDYTALAATTLTFTGGGVTQRTVAVSTIEDTIVEGTEDYAVVIGNQSVGNLGTSQATTNILDNDATLLNWNIAGSTQISEGVAASYTVSYTGATLAPGQTATISVVSSNLAGGSPNATAGSDYGTVSTVLTFTGGSATTRTIQVTTVNDTIVEDAEDYRVTIGGQSAGSVGVSQANTIILDNDATAFNWSVSGDTAIGEGAAGIFTVSYTGVTIGAGQTATITVASADLAGGSTNATPGVDYTAINTVLTFTSGSGMSRTVAVSAIQDTFLEGTEDFRVTIGGQSSGSITTSQANTVIVDVSGDFRINEVSVGASVTAPGGVATSNWIELRNTAGTAQLTSSISLQILGATGSVKTVALPSLSVPAGGFVVLYEQGADMRYGVYNSAGVLQSSGLIGGGGSWNFGTDTTQRIGVNILASGASTDLFIANGASAGSFAGAPAWTSPGLSGGGYAAAAGLFSGTFALLTGQDAYNGQVDNQTTILQKLGLRGGAAQPASNDVFLRVDISDNNNGTDWVTANANGDTAGATNNATYANPNDPGETITHDQGTATVGEGQDIVHAALAGGAVLDGLLGNDFLYGNAGIDTLIGGGGDDFLFGHSGNDRLFGGPGGDLLVDVAGTVAPNAGDYLEGGSGHDIVLGSFGASANNVTMLIVGDVSLTASSSGNDWLTGGNASDTIIGDNINFSAFSQATFLANPFAVGQPSVAYFNRGGTGLDTITGRGGNDVLGGAGGEDSIFGDDPSNLGIIGNDTIDGDAGNDFADGGPGSDLIDLGAGVDIGRGGFGADTIDGNADSDFIEGESDNDFLSGGSGGDQIYGDNDDGSQVGDDTIFSGFDGDFASGGSGSDLIFGEQGADWLDGDYDGNFSSGNDTLHGGTQDDTLVGGPGIDLYGLDGANTGIFFDFANAAPAPGGWQTMTPGGGLGTDWFREMEGVMGSGFNDTISDGIAGGQYYAGGAGGDLYIDGEGQDVYDMAAGTGPGDHDTLTFGAITLSAMPNSVIGFGTFFDAVPPDNGDQDYIDVDAIFDAFGVATADRASRVQIFDPGPGSAPVELQIDPDGPGVGTFVTLIIFEGITTAGGFSFGNSASDDIQLGTL